MVSGRTGEYSSEVDMGRKRVQLLVLLPFVMTFMISLTNCADSNTTVTSTTANTTTSRNATNPASTTTTDPAISDNPATSPPSDPYDNEFVYAVRDPETGKACISLATSISIKANYVTTSYDIKETFLKIPPTAEMRGTCRGVAPTMELIWAEDPTLEGTLNRITLMLGSEHITFSINIIGFELYIDGKNFPDAIQKGKKFKCDVLEFDEFSVNEHYRCKPETIASTVDVDITFPRGSALARPFDFESVSTRTEENGVSGADMTQWSGYLLLAAKILIFLKLGHQGI